MLDDHIRPRGAKLLERVVARQHRAGADAAVPRGLDVMLHVADENRRRRVQRVLGQNFVNLPPLVPHAEIKPVEEFTEARRRLLPREMILRHRAQDKRAKPAHATELEELPRVRQRDDRRLREPEVPVKPFLQLRERNVRHVAGVKALERQAEFRRDSQRHLRLVGHAGR